MRRRLVLAIALLAAATVPSAARAEEPVSLVVVPSAATLSADHPTTLRVVIRNDATVPICCARLELLAGAGSPFHATAEQPQGGLRIAARAARVMTVTVDEAPPGAAADRLELLLRYRRMEGATPVAGAATAVVALAPPPALDASAIAAVDVQAPARLRSGGSASIYASVTNRSAHPLTVRSIEAARSDYVTVDWNELKRPAGVVVKPGRTLVLAGTVSAEDSVRAGPEPLVTTTTLSAGASGSELTVVVSRSIDLGHAGETDALSALGVPALVLMPGFLLVGTMILLARLGIRRRPWDVQPFPLDLAAKEVLILSVSISFVLVGVYWLLTGTDLLDVYGLQDLVALWVGSIVLGAIAYGIWIWCHNKAHDERTPTADDTPLDVLRRLHEQKRGLAVDRVKVGANADARVLYLLEPADPKREMTWLAPAIDVVLLDAGDPARQQQVQTQLDQADAEPEAVAAMLAAAQQDGAIALRFAPNGSEDGPRLFAREKLGDPQHPERITQLVLDGEGGG